VIRRFGGKEAENPMETKNSLPGPVRWIVKGRAG